MMRTGMLLLSLSLASFSGGAEPVHASGAPATTSHELHGAATTGVGAKAMARPVVPESSPLGGSMLILIAGLFLAAVIVGPVVRYHAPEEAPDASSHDEPGHDGHAHDSNAHQH